LAIAVALTPTEVQSQLSSGPTLLMPTTSAPIRTLVITPVRDPFQPTIDDRIIPEVDQPMMPARRSASPQLEPLPANAGAGAISAELFAPIVASSPRVAAIVTGARPSAIIEDHGEDIMLTVGSQLGRDTVVWIRPNTIGLSSGKTLRLEPPSSGAK
jgi:hypothetical protein